MLLSCIIRHQRKYINTGSLLFVTSFVLMFTPTTQYIGFNGGGLSRTLETLQAHACDGDQLRIVCPSRTVISIQYAKYGRSVPSSMMCPPITQRPTFRDLLLFGDSPLIEDTNCIAVRSLEVMLDLCEDRASCAVRASPDTFTQDPCEGTSKYLEAHYKCRPSQFETQTVCEGDELEIYCGRGDRIAVYSAMFGRTPNGSDQCPANKQGYIDCQAAGSITEVRGQCQGRKNCAIVANESVFGDPCAAGINKYLTVSYACVPKDILKKHRQLANKKKKRKRKKKKKKKDGEEVTKITTESETTEASPTQTSGDRNFPDNSFPEVYETFEQSSVTQLIPEQTTVEPDADSGVVDNSRPYNTRGGSDDKDNVPSSSGDRTRGDDDSDDNVDNPAVNQLPGSSDSSNNNNNNNNINNSNNNNKDNLGRVKGNNPGANPTNNPSPDTTSTNNVRGQGSRPDIDSNKASNPNVAKGSNDPDTPFVTERNLTVCINYTRPDVRWGGVMRPRSERTIGFLKDWFSAIHFLESHPEKAWLYFVLGICFGIIVMLVVILIKVCINFRRNTRARLDVSEPTHRSAYTNNHSLDAPMLEHSDSIDRIEVVRFSPRSTLRSLRSNSHHRDLVNYYG